MTNETPRDREELARDDTVAYGPDEVPRPDDEVEDVLAPHDGAGLEESSPDERLAAPADDPEPAPDYTPDDLWADDLLDDGEDAAGPSTASRELRAELDRLRTEYDRAGFVRTAVEAVTSQEVTIVELYRDVLTPLLVDLGGDWQHGRVSIWQEHMAAAMVRTVVEILYPGVLKAKAAVPDSGRSVLLATPPEENHELGLRMVADRFDMAGWTTHYLGADSPAAEIIDAARRLSVDAVILSSATHFHRMALRGLVDRLERELDHVYVWVGGSAFADGDDEGWATYETRDLEALLREFAAGTSNHHKATGD